MVANVRPICVMDFGMFIKLPFCLKKPLTDLTRMWMQQSVFDCCRHRGMEKKVLFQVSPKGKRIFYKLDFQYGASRANLCCSVPCSEHLSQTTRVSFVLCCSVPCSEHLSQTTRVSFVLCFSRMIRLKNTSGYEFKSILTNGEIKFKCHFLKIMCFLFKSCS